MIVYEQLFIFTHLSTAANISIFIGFLTCSDDIHEFQVIACERNSSIIYRGRPLMDLTFHNFPASIQPGFAEKIVRPYCNGNLRGHPGFNPKSQRGFFPV